MRRPPQDPRAGLEEPKADLVAPDARIKAQDVVGKRRELTHQLDADQTTTDHDDRQTLAPLHRIRGCVCALEALDQMISQYERIRHRLEGQILRRARNQSVVGRCAKRNHEMVIRQAVRATVGRHGSDDLSFEIDGYDGGFDETCSSKGGADGLRATAQLQLARACLEQERREHEVVLAAHERDLDVCAPPQDSLELSYGRDTTESAAKYDDTHSAYSESRDYLGERSATSKRSGLRSRDVENKTARDDDRPHD